MERYSQQTNGTGGQSAAVQRSATHRGIFRALLALASAALLIRAVGMVNQVVVSAHFGAGTIMDAYLVASLLPIIIAQLIVGAIQNSVIPVYARFRTRATKEEASLLLSTLRRSRRPDWHEKLSILMEEVKQQEESYGRSDAYLFWC